MKRAARLAYNIFIILLILNFCWKALELILKVTLETRCCISIKNKDIDGFKNSLADCQHYFYLGPNNIRFIHDRTLLHLACEYRFPEAVKFLLEKGANPNLQDDAGQNPLFDLFRNKYDKNGLDCFNLLVDADDSILGFTTVWLNAVAARCEQIDVITMQTGRIAVSENQILAAIEPYHAAMAL